MPGSCVPPEVPRGELVSLPFQLLVAASIPWLRTHPQSQSSWAKFLSRCHFSGPVFPLSPLHLEGCLRLHCTQDKSRIISKILSQRISNFNSICKLNALLPRSLPYSQVPGFRTDIFGRSLPLTYELEGGRCFSWKGRGR